MSTDEWCLWLDLIIIQYMHLKQRVLLLLLITHTCIAVNPELFGSISSEAIEYWRSFPFWRWIQCWQTSFLMFHNVRNGQNCRIESYFCEQNRWPNQEFKFFNDNTLGQYQVNTFKQCWQNVNLNISKRICKVSFPETSNRRLHFVSTWTSSIYRERFLALQLSQI